MNRDILQDILKGLAIILVVYGHMARGMLDAGLGPTGILGTIDFIIYTTHMPVFFLIAGYNAWHTTQRHGTGPFLRSRGWALVYPYLLWSGILWGTKMATALIVPVNSPATVSQILNIGWEPISPFWFLYALLLMQLAFVGLRTRTTALLLMATAVFCVTDLTGNSAPYILRTTFLHIPFFALGAWLAAQKAPLIPAWITRPTTATLTTILFATLSAAILILLPQTRPVGTITLPLTLCGITLLMALSQACTKLPKLAGAMAYLGRHSFPIYLMHILLTAQVRIIMAKLGLDNSLLMLTLGTTAGLIGPLVAYHIAQRLHIAGWLGLTGKAPEGLAKTKTKKSA